MSGICFDPNGVSEDVALTTSDFEQALNILDEYKIDVLNIDIYNKFEKIFNKAKERGDRTIHMVVTEPVEYDYDDSI